MGFINLLITLVPIAEKVGGSLADTIAHIKASAAANGYYADTQILDAVITEAARREAIAANEKVATQ